MLPTKQQTIDKIVKASELSRSNYSKEEFGSFTEIMEYIEGIEDDDYGKGRHAMHYLFQGMYDVIQKHGYLKLMWAYEGIVRKGKKYFSSYYLGNPKIQDVKDMLYLKELLQRYDKEYRYKMRGNFDSWGGNIHAGSVSEYLSHAVQSTEVDAIIGIASSASEPAMALSGIIRVPVYFVRYSKRRADGEVKFLSPEYREELHEAVKGKKVMIIDDYVDSGKSMRKVMDAILSMGPIDVVGTSIKNSSYSSYLDTITDEDCFGLFKIKETEDE